MSNTTGKTVMEKTLLGASLILSSMLLLIASAANASIPTEKVYNTGEQIEKPMIMSRFIEMSSARKVPNVSFKDTHGESIKLKQFKGKLLMVNL